MNLIRLFISSLVISGVLMTSLPSSSFAAGAPACSKIFGEETSGLIQENPSFLQRLKNSAINYGKEVTETRGRRLFLKNSEADGDGDGTKWYGLLTKQNLDIPKTGFFRYLDAIFSYVPRKLGSSLAGEKGYAFTPFEALYKNTFRKPVEYLTQKYSNRKLQPAFFFKIPVILTLSMSMFHGADVAYQHQLQSHIQHEITANAPAYDKLVQNDFRYKKIKSALATQSITPAEAQREAYSVSLAYSQYFKHRDSSDENPTVQSEMKLIKHYLFAHLENIVVNGVQKVEPSEGYIVPDSAVGKISEQQILTLFGNTHQRYLKYQIIVEMVGQTPLWDQIRTHPKMQALVSTIVNDPFTTQLYQLRDQGRITNDELIAYLQEDAFWINSFQNWQTVGMTRLKKENNVYTNQPLTLSDIREEVLVEIATRTTK